MNVDHHAIKPQVTEEFFTPPNKQSYFEYESPTKTTPHQPVQTPNSSKEDTFDFDMSELDDLMNYDPTPQGKSKHVETSAVATDLLDQLQSLEDEMKESRRSSNASMTSKSSALYATVQKRTTSGSSVPGEKSFIHL